MSTDLNCPETLVGLDDDIDLTFLLPEETDLYLGIESELDKLFRSGPEYFSVEKLSDGESNLADPRKRTKRVQNRCTQSPEMGSLELLLSDSIMEDLDQFSLTDVFKVPRSEQPAAVQQYQRQQC